MSEHNPDPADLAAAARREGEEAALTAAEREEAQYAMHFLGQQAQVAQAEGHAVLLQQQAQAWDRASAAVSLLALVTAAHAVKRLLVRGR